MGRIRISAASVAMSSCLSLVAMGSLPVAQVVLTLTSWAAPVWGGDSVAFNDIKGARRADGDTWYLALAGPVNANVLAEQVDIDLQPEQPTPLITVPDYLTGKEFTVLLKLADVTGGILRLESPSAPGDVRSTIVSSDGWTALRFGPTTWDGELSLTIRATAAVHIAQVTVYRSFDQLFGKAGRVDIVGAAYHKLGDDEILSYPLLPSAYKEPRTGQWRRPEAAREDGIRCVRLSKSYQSFLNGPLQDELGLHCPVRAPNGVVFYARMKGRFAFIVYPEKAKYILTWKGEKDTWSSPVIHLDGAALDGNGNRIYTGLKKLDWATAKTWADNYGTGFLDFALMLPQNEIRIEKRRPSRLVFQYKAVQGLKSLSVDVQPITEAVTLVNSGNSRTEILLRSHDSYTLAACVEDSLYPDCLAVKAGSIRFEK